MFASPIHHQKYTARRVSALSPILKHLNTGTLAFALFVALALLSSTHGKDSQTRESAPVKATKTEVAIDNFSFSPNTLTLSVGATVTWTNHDNVPHVLSSTDNQFKQSTVLKAWRELFPHLRDHGNLLLFLCHPLSNDRENHRQANIQSDPLHEIIVSLTSLILFEGRTFDYSAGLVLSRFSRRATRRDRFLSRTCATNPVG
jgi:plastocyanin